MKLTRRGSKRSPVGSGYILGLDIGTSQVRALLVKQQSSGNGMVIGVGSRPCRGLRRGELVKLDSVIEAITPAIEEAEDMAGVEVAEAWLGLSGSQVTSINVRASVVVNNPSRGVTEADKQRVLRKVKEEKLSEGFSLLHAIPQHYDVGSRKGIIDPIKMTADKLWLNAHLIQVADSVTLDFARCVRQARVEVMGFTLQSLAAARAVLYAEEMASGVVVIDIGGGTTDYAVFHQGVLRHTGLIQVGGDHVSNDISIGLRIQVGQAEEAKLGFASVVEPDPSEDDICHITPGPGNETNRISKRKLHIISRCRVEEVFDLIKRELEKEGIALSSLASGAVLTGGGSLLEGIESSARQALGLKARRGQPWGLDGLEGLADGTQYATVAGLVKYGLEQEAASRRRVNRTRWGRFLDKYL